jgi:hypothetical protein
VPLVLRVHGGDSIIADEREGEHQDLAAIRRVREGLGVADLRV